MPTTYLSHSVVSFNRRRSLAPTLVGWLIAREVRSRPRQSFSERVSQSAKKLCSLRMDFLTSPPVAILSCMWLLLVVDPSLQMVVGWLERPTLFVAVFCLTAHCLVARLIIGVCPSVHGQ